MESDLIKRLLRERPHLREPLQFYRRVAALLGDAAPDDLTGVLVQEADRPLRLARGMPLIDPPRFARADLTATAGTLDRVLRLMATRNQSMAQVGRSIDLTLGTGSLRTKRLAAMLAGHSPALPQDVPLEVLGFVLRTALRPSLIPLLGALEQVFSDRAWNRPFCPLCGFPPGLAVELEHDRRLFCSFCPAQWRYTVRGCPFCGNAAEQHLACAVEDVEPGYHVAICTRCRGYLKTAHPHEIGRDIDPPLEDLLTVPLDHAAQRDGYRPAAAVVAG